jgi:hypothetical protein
MSKEFSWPSRQYTWPFLKLNTVHGEGFGLTKPTNPMLIEPSKCGLFTANRFADLIHVICRKGCVRHRAHLPISHIQHFSPLNSGLHVRIPGTWASDSENVMGRNMDMARAVPEPKQLERGPWYCSGRARKAQFSQLSQLN